MGWTAWLGFPAAPDFSLFHSIQTNSMAHPASYPVVTVVLFSGVKLQGCKTALHCIAFAFICKIQSIQSRPQNTPDG
jgi:hypothetical protein